MIEMQDPVEVRVRIERMLTRVARRDDYGHLLARGEVVRRRDEVESPDAWRSGLRRQARADRIRIRTGADGDVLWALLVDGDNDQRRAENDRYSDVLRTVVPAAVGFGHEPEVIARDGDEALFRCDRCPALGYADAKTDFFGGRLIENPCPDDREPRMTALSFLYGSKSRII